MPEATQPNRLHVQTPMLVRELRNQVPTDLKFLVVLLEFACIWWCATCWFRTERSLWPSYSSTLCYRILPQRKQMELKSQASKYHKVPKLVYLCYCVPFLTPPDLEPQNSDIGPQNLESVNLINLKPKALSNPMTPTLLKSPSNSLGRVLWWVSLHVDPIRCSSKATSRSM